MSNRKYYCVIEVKVPCGPEGWQMVVNDKMRHTLEKLKVAVEELGGRVFVRYSHAKKLFGSFLINFYIMSRKQNKHHFFKAIHSF